MDVPGGGCGAAEGELPDVVGVHPRLDTDSPRRSRSLGEGRLNVNAPPGCDGSVERGCYVQSPDVGEAGSAEQATEQGDRLVGDEGGAVARGNGRPEPQAVCRGESAAAGLGERSVDVDIRPVVGQAQRRRYSPVE